jgi:chromosome segregation ATPase
VQASVYEADLEKMSVDLGAIEEYKKRKADYEARAAELDAVTAQRDEVRQEIGKILQRCTMKGRHMPGQLQSCYFNAATVAQRH